MSVYSAEEAALLIRAKIRHDETCGCLRFGERYFMSCPQMAAAILAAGEEERSMQNDHQASP